jgi:hypothetical protein
MPFTSRVLLDAVDESGASGRGRYRRFTRDRLGRCLESRLAGPKGDDGRIHDDGGEYRHDEHRPRSDLSHEAALDRNIGSNSLRIAAVSSIGLPVV